MSHYRFFSLKGDGFLCDLNWSRIKNIKGFALKGLDLNIICLNNMEKFGGCAVCYSELTLNNSGNADYIGLKTQALAKDRFCTWKPYVTIHNVKKELKKVIAANGTDRVEELVPPRTEQAVASLHVTGSQVIFLKCVSLSKLSLMRPFCVSEDLHGKAGRSYSWSSAVPAVCSVKFFVGLLWPSLDYESAANVVFERFRTCQTIEMFDAS